ncbi:SRPBCC family protein [Pedobacter sp. SYSU D00535]|uniref:SRPBCC family protein n=1 Tax=Pedobacter sp. SYSU D00535 TaxID=2810308 RepID=UPI001A9634CC|nr:SRPBCC family protein [Pedobacter sp. SYSU D00535]
METVNSKAITVETRVEAPMSVVWNYWNQPEHITNWCFATEDWHAPFSENDLRPGGKLRTTMAAKDGSFSFDFEGTYEVVEENKRLVYVLGDGRKVEVLFGEEGGATTLVETFDMETTHPEDMQRQGWQAILDNFKKYTEAAQQ